MSLVFGVILIAIARLFSAIIDGLPHLGHIFSIAPLWLTSIVVMGAVSWLISEP